jgi:hypothetical protein
MGGARQARERGRTHRHADRGEKFGMVGEKLHAATSAA